MHRRSLVVAGIGALAVAGVLAGPASADASTQAVSFTVVSGTLAITPGTPSTGVNSALSGSTTTVTVPLGLTTVADTRVSSSGWSVSASTTDFTQTLPATGTISKSNASFSVPLAPIATVGSATFTRDSAATAVDGTGTVAGLVVATATGVNTGTFTPQLLVTVPNGSASGVYGATVTQSAT